MGQLGRRTAAIGAAVSLMTGAAAAGWAATAAADSGSQGGGDQGGGADGAAAYQTATPIKHLVVVFQENVSFDHYFGTYPFAANTDGNPFRAPAGTPSVNGLGNPADPGSVLLFHNPNSANPQRLSPAQALTCDQNHDYTPEQQAFDHGLMDRFVQYTGTETCKSPDTTQPGLVMDYYDGNTVTALWNYAQHFAMSDNSFGTVFGPSTPGAINLVSGQTHGVTPATSPGVTDNGTVYSDADPLFDDCSAGTKLSMSGRNVGDLLNQTGVTWGWFQGGFRPTSTTSAGAAVCGSSHTNIGGAKVTDYSAHHEPFEYYQSTSNPHHLPPANSQEIGHNGQANHQYDLSDFYTALADHNLPAVSYVKAAKYQDGHAGYSDPIDEQHFVVSLINRLEASPEWKSTAVVISYDDSDGWYDHVMSPVVNSSQSTEDALSGTGQCGNGTPAGGYQDRCGYGPRLPLLVVSAYSRANFVDDTLTDQSSILRFVEDNWLAGERVEPATASGADGMAASFDNFAGSLNSMFDFSSPPTNRLVLDPNTGEPTDQTG